MRWEDERYVRLYTRDTLTTKRLGWEGRAVLWELFRKVDRAGLAEIGDETPAAALTGLTGIPEKICAIAWSRLSSGKAPVVTLRDGDPRALFIPNFMPAQEARQSDKARQQKRRELSRIGAIVGSAGVSRNVTDPNSALPNVTPSHGESRGVTPSCSVPNLDPKNVDRSSGGDPGEENSQAVSLWTTPDVTGLTDEQKAQVQGLFQRGQGLAALDLLANLRPRRGTA